MNSNTNTTEKKKPISLLTASLDKIKAIAARQPNSLQPSPWFIKQQQEMQELLKNTKPQKIYY